MSNTAQQIGAILSAIIGVAIIAALISKNANTSQVIQTAASGFSTILGTALGPITGGGSSGGGGSSSGGSPFSWG